MKRQEFGMRKAETGRQRDAALIYSIMVIALNNINKIS